MPDLFDQLNDNDKGAIRPRRAELLRPLPPERFDALYDPLHPIDGDRPLADRMRPTSLDDYMGQEKLVGPESLLRRLIERDELCSMLFWGPPGSGKTTLATLVARASQSNFIALSAVAAGVKDVKAFIEQSRKDLRETGQRSILFLDEIHRFNKAQQDALLPAVEGGLITLIGATTENPSFSVIAPLLSRCRVFTLQALTEAQLVRLLRRALGDLVNGLGAREYDLEDGVLETIVSVSDGDARRALNLLELAARSAQPDSDEEAPTPLRIDQAIIKELCQREHLIYDKSGEEHFNLISALHKSLRASDVQAALYWCERMLASGEDPRYVARRMIRFASEDIGMADPHALPMALAALEAYQNLGTPEGELALIQAAAYLATAPKSNALYMAQKGIQAEIARSGSLPVPFHIRNAPTGLMKEIGYGKGYVYDHDAPDRFSGQECLPDALKGTEFYEPVEMGFERDVRKRIEYWKDLRKNRREKGK